MAEKKDTTTPGFDPAEFEAAASRVRELNEKFIDASRKAGNGALDAYEHTLTNMLEMEQKAAGATQLDWIGVMADTHAMARDSRAYR